MSQAGSYLPSSGQTSGQTSRAPQTAALRNSGVRREKQNAGSIPAVSTIEAKVEPAQSLNGLGRLRRAAGLPLIEALLGHRA
jgi:hypothetical protein